MFYLDLVTCWVILADKKYLLGVRMRRRRGKESILPIGLEMWFANAN